MKKNFTFIPSVKNIVFFFLTFIIIILAVSATVQMVILVRGLSVSTPEEISFLAGFIVYLLIHFLLYKPIFAHVMAHELTHILWAAVFGGKTQSLHVSKTGGKVLISKSNFIISLAPYFFPLYAMAATLIYYITRDEYRVYAAFFVGASLSFHIALTLFSLTTSQSDLRQDSNLVFSLAFVYLMNIIIIALILTVITKEISFAHFGNFLLDIFKGVGDITVQVVSQVNAALK
ncbi:MAG: hypothetical protein WCJ94_05095 [bacterium]